jgi:hypothetical protein
MTNRAEAFCAAFDAKALAAAVVAETASLDEADAIMAKAKKCMTDLSDEVAFEELKRYGMTFRCVSCKKKQLIARKMNGHRSLWKDTPACPVAMCYDCAMKSSDKCPLCRHEIWYWEGGPMPYVSVRLFIRDCQVAKYYRFEIDPATTTFGQVKELMLHEVALWHKYNPPCEFSSIVVANVTAAPLDATLCDLGVRSGETAITVGTK